MHRGLYEQSGFFAAGCADRGGGGAAPGRAGGCSPATARSRAGSAPLSSTLAGRVRSADDGATETDYLEAVLNANVYDVAIETPLQEAPLLSQRLGNRLFLKREDLQPVFSFKLRGAYNKMSRLSAAELRRGVVAASAGNHAQGVALAAQRLGTAATIVMPVTTPQIKIDSVAALGASSCSRATRTTTPTPRRCGSGGAGSSCSSIPTTTST